MHCNIFVADIMVDAIYSVEYVFMAGMPAIAYIIYHMINPMICQHANKAKH